MSYCPKCGKEMKEGDNFCGSCGYSMKAEDAPVSNDVTTDGIEAKEKILATMVLRYFIWRYELLYREYYGLRFPPKGYCFD
ncbi:MAG: zinc ribbon domain-containing protein [Selenomonadaceae bacterium]|nr:zinc ribbon domain-containing protein [Selenomonadaceae bacterium]